MGRATATACYRELGDELRKRREQAGLTGAELARRMGTTQTKISRIELAARHSTFVDVISYLAFLGIQGPAARDLVELCREAERNLGYWLSPHGEWLPDTLNSLIYHESTAAAVTRYEPQFVDGLLQTADYARAMIGGETWRSPDDVESCVQIRMERQRILHLPRPPEYTFYLHEQALHRRIGDPAVMQEQLLKILLLGALDHVNIRVVPADMAFGGQFYLFEFAAHAPLAYLDHPSTGLFLEDEEYVAPYRRLASNIADAALDEGQSREFIATLANEHDRGSERDVDMEEEQL